MNFDTLRAANEQRAEEWMKGEDVSLTFRGNELAGEVGEACNVIKKLEREARGFVGSRATLGDLADEIADVVICCDLVLMKAGMDLGEAVRRKFNYTSTKYGLSTRIDPTI